MPDLEEAWAAVMQKLERAIPDEPQNDAVWSQGLDAVRAAMLTAHYRACTDLRPHCHAGRDGDCAWDACPQTRDEEPASTGRSCPLAFWGDEEEEWERLRCGDEWRCAEAERIEQLGRKSS